MCVVADEVLGSWLHASHWALLVDSVRLGSGSERQPLGGKAGPHSYPGRRQAYHTDEESDTRVKSDLLKSEQLFHGGQGWLHLLLSYHLDGLPMIPLFWIFINGYLDPDGHFQLEKHFQTSALSIFKEDMMLSLY